MGSVVGIDLGTSYCKAVVVSQDGTIQGMGRHAVPVETHGLVRTELSVSSFERTIQGTVEDALDAANKRAVDIEAISYSSQANTFGLFDRAMSPLTPFVIWSDRRVTKRSPEVSELTAEAEFLEVTGLGLFSDQMCPAKLIWFRDFSPEVWQRTAFVVTISDYLTYILTECLAGDSSTASLLGIWDVKRDQYWDAGLRALRLNRGLFADLHRPGRPVGTATGSMARRLGVRESAVVVAGALDHYVAAIGAGVGRLGQASESTGTVLAVLSRTDTFDPAEGTSIGPDVTPGEFYKLAFNDNGAQSVEWYQSRFAPHLSLDELSKLAAQVPPGSEGVRARVSPHAYSNLHGFSIPNGWEGQSLGHGPYFRSLLEGVAFSLRRMLRENAPPSGYDKIIATGGGAQNDVWLQIKADVLGLSIVRTKAAEPAAYGAAMLATRGTTWFQGVEEAPSKWQSVDAVFEPSMSAWQTYQEMDNAPTVNE